MMDTKEVVVEVPKSASTKDVRHLVMKIFSFNVRKYYGKAKDFPLVRVKWLPSA